MVTAEQSKAWSIVCIEGYDIGLRLVHYPSTSLLTLPIPAHPNETVHLVRHDDPDKAIEEARSAVARHREKIEALHTQESIQITTTGVMSKPTQEQLDAWTALCNEAREIGLLFIHYPKNSLPTAIPAAPNQQVVYFMYDDLAQTLGEAKRSIAFKRAYPIDTQDPEELKERHAAFNAQYIA